MVDAPFWDDDNEDQMQQIIYASARGVDFGGEGGGQDDGEGGGDDDFGSQFLNDSGEGLLFDDEVPLTTNSDEVYTFVILADNWSIDHYIYICIC